MGDNRAHRGPHPQDRQLFRKSVWPKLNTAVDHLSWLLSRGYPDRSALELVGDRFDLRKRQRVAVARSACSDEAQKSRKKFEVGWNEFQNKPLLLDGYNVLTSLEAASAGGILLRARDSSYRDMASMHGNYRTVQETRPAIKIVGDRLHERKASYVLWYLDRPVSNSGKLKSLLLQAAGQQGWNWQVELVQNPDALLKATKEIVATADSDILDSGCRWLNLVQAVISLDIPDAWVIPMDGSKTCDSV